MLERDVQHRCVDYARSLGVLARKFSSPAQRDVPDYLFFFAGRIYLVEYKATGKHPRASQEREHELLRVAGHVVDVVDSVGYGNHRMYLFINNALDL